MSMIARVVISPATKTTPVVTRVSIATRDCSSFASTASSRLSEIWSAILSGWPSVTDSEVTRDRPFGMHVSFRMATVPTFALAERQENTGVAGRKSTKSYGPLSQEVLQRQRQIMAGRDLHRVRGPQRGAERFGSRDLEIDRAGPGSPGQ